MEIYKLSDEMKSSQRSSSRLSSRTSRYSSLSSRNVSGDVVSDYLITDLKQGARNQNRVNVFVNNEYMFSLDLTQVVDYKLKVGKVLSAEELMKLKKASEFGKLYQRTLEWVLTRPRSTKETRDYLIRKIKTASFNASVLASRQEQKGTSQLFASDEVFTGDAFDFSEEIIRRLTKKGYIDDRKFAEFYVENRFVKKGVSRKRLEMELMKKGIDREIIEEVLDGRNDEEEIRKIMTKKRGKYDDEKMIAYLCRQGFSYDLVRKIVAESD